MNGYFLELFLSIVKIFNSLHSFPFFMFSVLSLENMLLTHELLLMLKTEVLFSSHLFLSLSQKKRFCLLLLTGQVSSKTEHFLSYWARQKLINHTDNFCGILRSASVYGHDQFVFRKHTIIKVHFDNNTRPPARVSNFFRWSECL